MSSADDPFLGGTVVFAEGRGYLGGDRRRGGNVAPVRCFSPRQFENPDNANAHRFRTARRPGAGSGGRVDAVVSGGAPAARSCGLL